MDFDETYNLLLQQSFHSERYHSKSRPRIAYTWNRIAHLIEPSETVVEIGVGPLSPLVKVLTGAEVIGVDHTTAQMRLCQAFGIELRPCDIQNQPLPLSDNSVDMVLLLEVIEHLCMYPTTLLTRIYDKLKPGGYLVLTTVNFLRLSNRLRMLAGRNPLLTYCEPSEGGRNHIREYVLEEMRHYIRDVGFQVTETALFQVPSKGLIGRLCSGIAGMLPRHRNYFLVIARKQ